jgi:hypothetical protein
MAVRGALIEYSGQFIGPLPNIVVFQFNPEQIVRTLTLAGHGAEGSDRRQRAQTERNTSAGPPTEEFSVTIALSAAEDLGTPGPFSGVTRLYGVGPQIAALEKMAYPPGGGIVSGILGGLIDAVGSLIAESPAASATRPIPRESLPRLLFIWGPMRVLPVSIKSIRITEQEYDNMLNPTKAEVEIGLRVATAPASDDVLAQGALIYTNSQKELQVVAQMARGIASLPAVIGF